MANNSKKGLSFPTLFSLLEDTDVEGTIDNIQKAVTIKGANIWMLFSAAILACIGLDTNSTAVIIGAMLVSPLMSPILGIGLGVGIDDRPLLVDSLKNFGIAIIFSLLASITYFSITPLGEITSELTARTSPTLLDVGIALFGGVAGIVAGSRKEKTTAIPGVAIATALMPPLCTAGFGVATGQPKYFLGAFYLFFINAFFISLATFLMVQILQFPHREFADLETRSRIRRWIAIFAIIVIIPSTVIFYGVIQDLRINKKIQSFISEKINNGKRNAMQWEVVQEETQKILKIYLFGEPFTENQTGELKSQLLNYGLGQLQLSLIQMNVPKNERQKLSSEIESTIMQKVAVIQQSQEIKDKQKKAEVNKLEQELVRLKGDPKILESVKNELKILFPEIIGLLYVPAINLSTDASEQVIPLVIIKFEKLPAIKVQNQIKDKLEPFLKERFNVTDLKVVVEQD